MSDINVSSELYIYKKSIYTFVLTNSVRNVSPEKNKQTKKRDSLHSHHQCKMSQFTGFLHSREIFAYYIDRKMFLMKPLSMEKLSLVMIYYSDIHLQEKNTMYIKHKICSLFKRT